MTAAMCLPQIAGHDLCFELLWVKVTQGCEITFVGALYHPPKPLYATNDLLDYVEAAVSHMQHDAHLVLAGDLNQLSDNEVVIRTGMTSLVNQPTRFNNVLDGLYVSDFDYSGVKVIQSVAKSDHKAIVAYSGRVKSTIGKTRRVCTFRKHATVEHARFLAGVTDPIHIVNQDGRGDPQDEYDKLYRVMFELLDAYYPQRTVTITSADPPYITPAIKYMPEEKESTHAVGTSRGGFCSGHQDRCLHQEIQQC